MTRATFFIDVIVPLAVPNKYTYRLPQEMNSLIMKGQRVLVPFGKTRIYTGIVYNIHEKAPRDYVAKYVEGILDDHAVVTELQLQFWDWLSFYYCANPGDVMNAALPSGLKLSSTSHIQLNPEYDLESAEHADFNDKEHLVIETLQATQNLSFDDLLKLLKIKSVHALVNKMLRKGVIVVYEDVKDKYKPKLQHFLKLNAEFDREEKLHEALNQLEKKAFKQAEALLYFLHLQKSHKAGEWVAKQEVQKKSELSAINSLVKKKILIEEHFEVGRLMHEKRRSAIKSLSEPQQKAFEEIKLGFNSGKPVLLHGVTGSGKTEIYIRLIEDTIASGKQVLFLIPEIALTTQLITRLQAVFGEVVGVYHSRFSENERVEIWNNILGQDHITHGNNAGKPRYSIILGARSCLLLPFTNLGLIIVDEEHDNSFKQHDPAPRYHARDGALYLAHMHKANILLGSATPSVESHFNAASGKYALVKLANQYVAGGGTELQMCDLNKYESSNQMKASLTPPLFDAIRESLNKKHQVILFQNRRGFAPYTECRKCGHVPHCVQCDVSLIFHKHQQKLICHYCGYSVTPPKVCAACGSSELHYKGLGTEKIEEDISILFPDAKIARMDLDSTRSKYAYKQLLDDFESGRIDILIGTQMVTKGLDFNNVQVVGVLNADSILNFPDFRSFEKAFQLMTQVRGRAGRSSEIGKVFIQTAQTSHPVIELLQKRDFENFYKQTLSERQQFHYPPYSRLFEINVISKDQNEVNHLSQQLFNLLKPAFGNDLLGPEFPLISKIKNQFYKHILIKAPKQRNPTEVRELIFSALVELQNQHKTWRYRIAIDVDPV